jgi:hypothetical protein
LPDGLLRKLPILRINNVLDIILAIWKLTFGFETDNPEALFRPMCRRAVCGQFKIADLSNLLRSTQPLFGGAVLSLRWLDLAALFEQTFQQALPSHHTDDPP